MNREALRHALLFYVNTAFGGIAAGFFALGLNYFYQSNPLLHGLTDSDKSTIFGIFGIIFLVWGMGFSYFLYRAPRK